MNSRAQNTDIRVSSSLLDRQPPPPSLTILPAHGADARPDATSPDPLDVEAKQLLIDEMDELPVDMDIFQSAFWREFETPRSQFCADNASW